ncbi:MAG: hypothetical protein H0X39_18625 [Actinobacteria bacterium]|nr:hypothetical protein [Actinomycetota bacterium]
MRELIIALISVFGALGAVALPIYMTKKRDHGDREYNTSVAFGKDLLAGSRDLRLELQEMLKARDAKIEALTARLDTRDAKIEALSLGVEALARERDENARKAEAALVEAQRLRGERDELAARVKHLEEEVAILRARPSDSRGRSTDAP